MASRTGIANGIVALALIIGASYMAIAAPPALAPGRPIVAPGMTPDQVQQQISAAVAGLAKQTDVNAAISSATSGLASQASVSSAISSATANMATASSVNAAISSATAGLASSASVDSAISAATSGLATTSGMNSAIANAVSGLSTPASVSSAISTATAGLASTSALTSMQTSVMAAMPKPASTVPGAEVVGGAAGSSSLYRRADAVQPRITRSSTVTLDANGQATFDWTAQGALTTPVQVVLTPIYTGSGTPSCLATSVTATSVALKCMMGNSLNLTLSALTAASVVGLTLNPWSQTPSGMQVSVIALPKS